MILGIFDAYHGTCFCRYRSFTIRSPRCSNVTRNWRSNSKNTSKILNWTNNNFETVTRTSFWICRTNCWKGRGTTQNSSSRWTGGLRVFKLSWFRWIYIVWPTTIVMRPTTLSAWLLLMCYQDLPLTLRAPSTWLAPLTLRRMEHRTNLMSPDGLFLARILPLIFIIYFVL